RSLGRRSRKPARYAGRGQARKVGPAPYEGAACMRLTRVVPRKPSSVLGRRVAFFYDAEVERGGSAVDLEVGSVQEEAREQVAQGQSTPELEKVRVACGRGGGRR